MSHDPFIVEGRMIRYHDDAVVRVRRDGREVDAILYYQAATGEDLPTAKDVVERLAR